MLTPVFCFTQAIGKLVSETQFYQSGLQTELFNRKYCSTIFSSPAVCYFKLRKEIQYMKYWK